MLSTSLWQTQVMGIVTSFLRIHLLRMIPPHTLSPRTCQSSRNPHMSADHRQRGIPLKTWTSTPMLTTSPSLWPTSATFNLIFRLLKPATFNRSAFYAPTSKARQSNFHPPHLSEGGNRARHGSARPGNRWGSSLHIGVGPSR